MKKIILPLTLLVHLSLLVLLQFTAWPEMTLWPYLLLKGWLPYRDIAMAHNPLLIFGLAGYYQIFGVSLFSLKIFTWVIILLTDLLIYFVTKKLIASRKIAVLSVLFYVLWQPFFEGNGLWFDLALAPVALLIFLFLWKREFFWSGIFLGLAILVKQTAVWFIVPLIGQIWLMGLINKKNLAKLVMGGVIPLLLLFLYLFLTNTLSDFYFWAIKFGIFYLPKAPGQVDLPTIKQVLALVVPFAPIILAGFTILLQSNIVKNTSLFFILLIWFIFASLGVYPRWSLFHFQPALPFLSIISGVVIWYVFAGRHKIFWTSIASETEPDFKKRTFFRERFGIQQNFRADLSKATLIIFLLFCTLYLQFRFYKLNLRAGDRFFEPSTEVMASWIRENSKPNEKIFVFNSWDNLYAMTNTLPATKPWVPTLPWYLEHPGIQDKMVADLEKNKPALIIFEPYRNTGLGSYIPKQIDKFIKVNYTLKETVADRFWVMEERP